MSIFMISGKRVREITGYTHEKQSKDADAWYQLALSFYCAARVLSECCEKIPNDTRPFAFNAALSLELILKCLIAQKGEAIPNTHDLVDLQEKAGVNLSDSQTQTLELLTETNIWAGRYPAPLKETKWDDYHDRIFEKHIVRTRAGKTFRSMANRDTFPDWQNYERIWKTCVDQVSARRPSRP
jgi:HEPN domain-containing protein